MKALILIFTSLSLYGSTSTSCRSQLQSIDLQAKEFATKTETMSPRQTLNQAIVLNNKVYQYNIQCCKTQECNAEMYEAMNELDQIIKISSSMIKGDK